MGIVDRPYQDGCMTRGYLLSRHEMGAGRQHALAPSASSIYTSMMLFDNIATRCKEKWFLNHSRCLTVPDWRFITSRIKHSAACIQSHWRKCIASPYYTMCIKRLLREFHTLSIEPTSNDDIFNVKRLINSKILGSQQMKFL
jgi:hypothetical protein